MMIFIRRTGKRRAAVAVALLLLATATAALAEDEGVALALDRRTGLAPASPEKAAEPAALLLDAAKAPLKNEDGPGITDAVDSADLQAASTAEIPDSSGPEGPAAGANAFWLSFLLILIAEIGDKTFMIGAVMAMRHSRMQIFLASMSALALMTVLSAILGVALPNLLSRTTSKALAAVLFVVFAGKALQEALEMADDKAQAELDEVAREVVDSDTAKRADALEAGAASEKVLFSAPAAAGLPKDDAGAAAAPLGKRLGRPDRFSRESVTNLLTLLLSPATVQCFVMVFLAEWGDRSQLSTVALAGTHGLVLVSLGAVLGHAVCTALAVVGGQFLATRISLKSVTLLSAALFLVFGLLSAYECYVEYSLPSSAR